MIAKFALLACLVALYVVTVRCNDYRIQFYSEANCNAYAFDRRCAAGQCCAINSLLEVRMNVSAGSADFDATFYPDNDCQEDDNGVQVSQNFGDCIDNPNPAVNSNLSLRVSAAPSHAGPMLLCAVTLLLTVATCVIV